MAERLTETKVLRAKFDPAGGKIQRRWDAEVPGLGLEVFPSGRKSWIFRCRVHGRQKIFKLADVTDLRLDAAREEALKARATVRAGKDPSLLRGLPTDAMTVQGLYDLYTTGSYFLSRSPDFQSNMRSTWRRYIQPELGMVPVVAVERAHVRRMIQTLVDAGKEGAGRGLLQRLKILFNHAVALDLMESSPTDRLKFQWTTTGKRDQWLKTVEELRGAWWLDAPIQVRGCVRWMLLCGCRRDEARTARWDQIKDGIWTVAQTKNRRPLVLPITDLMQDVLDEMRSTFGPTEWVFPSTITTRKPIPRGTWDWALRQGTEGRWSAHVLRHTVETWLRELGVGAESRDLILNHVRQGSGDIYAHGAALDMKRDALEVWHQQVVDSL